MLNSSDTLFVYSKYDDGLFLQRVRHSADAQLVDRLQGISLGFIGDNTQLNCEAAQQTAKLLGYVPLTTPQIIQQLTNQRQGLQLSTVFRR